MREDARKEVAEEAEEEENGDKRDKLGITREVGQLRVSCEGMEENILGCQIAKMAAVADRCDAGTAYLRCHLRGR